MGGKAAPSGIDSGPAIWFSPDKMFYLYAIPLTAMGIGSLFVVTPGTISWFAYMSVMLIFGYLVWRTGPKLEE